VQQWFAAGDRHDRRAAVLDGREALLGSEVSAQDVDRMLDLAAPAASEVAAEERFEHQHERIPFAARNALTYDVRPDCHNLLE
jgi:hypothetical protein